MGLLLEKDILRTAHAVPVADSLALSTSCKKEKSNSVKSFDACGSWYGEADEDHGHVAHRAPLTIEGCVKKTLRPPGTQKCLNNATLEGSDMYVVCEADGTMKCCVRTGSDRACSNSLLRVILGVPLHGCELRGPLALPALLEPPLYLSLGKESI
jgi:hypothetical protein